MPTVASLLKVLSDKSNELHENVRNFVAVWQGATSMLDIAGNFGILSPMVQTLTIRDHSPPVEAAAEAMRQSLISLEPFWAPIIAVANNPTAHGLDDLQASQMQGRCQFTSGSIMQAQRFLEVFYRSRWHNESARRVPRLQAYTIGLFAQASRDAANSVYRSLVGPEYIAEQEEAARVEAELATQRDRDKGGFDLTSIGGLAVGLGAGLLGVWFLRRKK